MKVKEVLTPLQKDALTRLCRRRGLRESGTKAKICTRLARSYRGDRSTLVGDLRKGDLLAIASAYSDNGQFPSGLTTRPVSELRRVCLDVFEGRYMESEGSAGVVTEEIGNEERQPEGLDRGGFGIALYGTGNDGVPEMGHVDDSSLARMAKDADRVTILSAYYVPEVLKTIAGACPGDVRIVLNGLGGRRLDAQVAELQMLQATLRKRSRTAEIRLAFVEGVFHTKLYVFDIGRNKVAWIGSANATKAGLSGRNEEVLVRVESAPQSVLAYADSAWNRAKPVECCWQAVNSLIAFFRTGTLYYKPYATLQMTMNPFRQLMKCLPPEEKRKITAFHSEYADDEVGIGAFSLKLVFERMGGEWRETPVGRVEVRRNAVETCYGYWVTEPLVPEVEAMLRQASSGNRHRLEAIRKWMKTGRDAIVGAYASYLKDVRRMLDDEGVDWQKYAAQGLFEDTRAIEKRLDSLLAALGTEKRLARHCQAFAAGEVPEIWEDDVACASFADSFFESLAYASSAGRRTGSSKWILDCLRLSHTTADVIQKALEDALREKDWYEDNFR